MAPAAKPTSVTHSTNKQLAAKVVGQTFTIPNLYSFFPDWNVAINPNLDCLTVWFEGEWLPRWVKDPEIQYAVRKAAVPFYVSCMYPRIGLEELKGVNQFFAWFFFWDDLIDGGPLADDIQGTSKLCQDTISFVNICLGDDEPPKEPPSTIAPIQCFWDVGTAVWYGCSSAVRTRLRTEILRFVRAAEESQVERCSSATVSTVERYVERREINVGCRVTSMFSEYAARLVLPTEVFQSHNMQTVINETAKMVWLVNDLISMKKEFTDNQYESLIPILLYNDPSLTPISAVQSASVMLQRSYASFEETESRLYDEAKRSNWPIEDVKEFVHCCKDLVMSTVHWSYECRRYVKLEEIGEGKEVSFTIGGGEKGFLKKRSWWWHKSFEVFLPYLILFNLMI